MVIWSASNLQRLFYEDFWKTSLKNVYVIAKDYSSKEVNKNSIIRAFICVYPYLGSLFYLFGPFSQLNQSFIILPDCLQLVYLNLDIIHFILWLLNYSLQDVNWFLLSGRENVIWNRVTGRILLNHISGKSLLKTQKLGFFPLLLLAKINYT